jgi:hypothetical protein
MKFGFQMNSLIEGEYSMEKWQIQKAKNHFSDLVRKAQQEGPQTNNHEQAGDAHGILSPFSVARGDARSGKIENMLFGKKLG